MKAERSTRTRPAPLPRIIDIRSITRGGHAFNPNHYAAIGKSVAGNRLLLGAVWSFATILVHPLFCLLEKEKPEDAVYSWPHNYPLFIENFKKQQADPYYHYPSYKTRLEQALETTPVPVFVFTVPRHRLQTEAWLKSLSLQAPMIMVNTIPGEEVVPVPLFDNIPHHIHALLWQNFARIVQGLGINIIGVMGELYYRSEGRAMGVGVSVHHGCAGMLLDNLSDLKDAFDIQLVEALSDYTYPGFVNRPIDFEGFVNELAVRGGEAPPF